MAYYPLDITSDEVSKYDLSRQKKRFNQLVNGSVAICWGYPLIGLTYGLVQGGAPHMPS